jgi:hypothetical protein
MGHFVQRRVDGLGIWCQFTSLWSGSTLLFLLLYLVVIADAVLFLSVMLGTRVIDLLRNAD